MQVNSDNFNTVYDYDGNVQSHTSFYWSYDKK